MPYYIAFDSSHKERARLDENFTELRDYLNENGFICYNYLEVPITHDSLKAFDIFVVACPDFSKFSNIEIMEIENWVKEDGGGLLLLSHAGGDKGRNSNLSELSEQFGIAFENDQVLDEVNNIGIENMPIISSINFIPPHPITNNISSICYRAGCSLTVIGSSISIVSSNDTSEPFSSPIVCTSEPNKGRVCAIGSYEMFRDNTGGGFQYEDHPIIASNIFNWLISDYRMELTNQGADHNIPVASNSAPKVEESPSFEGYSSQVRTVQPFSSEIKFSTKEELLNILRNYSNQIETMKNSINKLIEIITESVNDIFSNQKVEVVQNPAQINPNYVYESYEDDEEMDYYTYLQSEASSRLTQLPPKPQTMKGIDPDNPEEAFTKPVPTAPSNIRQPIKKARGNSTSSKSKTKAKTTRTKVGKKEDEKVGSSDDLTAELNSLENKSNSVVNLIDFIEKKYKNGKIDDKTYEKQIQKLKKDLNQTNTRIEEIKKTLGKTK